VPPGFNRFANSDLKSYHLHEAISQPEPSVSPRSKR